MAYLILREFWSIRNLIIFIIAPILLLPVPIVIGNQESKCAYVLLLMAVYWTLEVIPVAATGLIPVLLFPLLGVLPVKDIVPAYATSSIILFVCGLIVACAVEHWNLHKRIALNTIRLFGATPNRLMMGMMLPTWFLSMWISNTATTAMMTPIVLAILDQLKHSHVESQKKRERTGVVATVDVPDVTVPIEDETTDSEQSRETKKSNIEYERLNKALTLCVAYAANVGGTASLIGTGPNIVLLEKTDKMYDKIGEINPINFGSWFMFGLPVSVICLVVIWFWIQLYFLRCKGFSKCRGDRYSKTVTAVINHELEKLGPFSFAEGATLINFIILALLWFFRGPRFMDGWASLFTTGYIKDACAAVLIVGVMFVFPSRVPRIFCCQDMFMAQACYGESEAFEAEAVSPLLTWKIVHEGVPWMIIWLLGGGFALAKGSEASGLSGWIGELLAGLHTLQPWVMLLILTVVAAAITEVTSNTAISAIFLPILRDMSLNIKIHPLYLMFPVALATSFAFMLPVATPPNAIVYSTGRFKLSDMIKAGFFLNIFCLVVLNLGANTWGQAAFDLYTFPISMAHLNSSSFS